jgi:hypothetical protein
MPGPLPKPSGTRVRNVPPTYSETSLPRAGRQGDAPPLPPLKSWHPATLEAWSAWWSTPQAVLWDADGKSLVRWAVLFDMIATDPTAPASVHAQLLQIEDRHGFSPQALAKLRWQIAAADPEPVATAMPKAKADRRRRVLAVTDAK